MAIEDLKPKAKKANKNNTMGIALVLDLAVPKEKRIADYIQQVADSTELGLKRVAIELLDELLNRLSKEN